MDPQEQTSVKSESKYEDLHLRLCICKCRLRKAAILSKPQSVMVLNGNNMEWVVYAALGCVVCPSIGHTSYETWQEITYAREKCLSK